MHTSLQELLAVRRAAAAARYDLYAGIHKGVRLMLNELLLQAGRVDAADPASVERLVTALDAAMDFCLSHLAHENDFVHPVLERLQPGFSQRIATEHQAHAHDIQALRAHARCLPLCAADERPAACHALYQALALFVAHNLAHMHLEETEHNALLWASLPDADIAAIEGQILARLSPPEMTASLHWMLPALAPAERLALLGGLRAQAPAPVFEAVLSLARSRLDDDAWGALARGLGVSVAPGLAA